MPDLNEHTITEAVKKTFDTSTDDRFRQLLQSLVQHLHDFAREVRLTGDEWFTAMDFIERLGKISSPTRQEVVLASDILGLSMLLDTMNESPGGSATASALLGRSTSRADRAPPTAPTSPTASRAHRCSSPAASSTNTASRSRKRTSTSGTATATAPTTSS
nr:dioxygenase [Mycobacterium florentinum]BBX76221.1 hypothetical protein MFLOJ_00080 [Mycobacterium florentinum]